MNTIESNLTASEQREIEAWCAEVRATHAQISQPIHEGESRYDQLLESPGYHISQFTPEELGELYFAFVDGNLPQWPLAAPEWVVDTEVRSGAYPEITVEFHGKDWATFGGFMARIEQMHTVFVDDFTNSDGTIGEYHRHDMIPGEARIFIQKHNEDLAADDALQLAIAIEDAATELNRYSSGN